MKVGFTGTREGMSLGQQTQLQNVLRLLSRDDPEREFHQGGSGLSDLRAVQYARQFGFTIAWHQAVGHEPDAKLIHPLDIVLPAKPPLDRDRVIANTCGILIAAPLTDREVLRSGTWATVRYARQAVRPVVMLSRWGA